MDKSVAIKRLRKILGKGFGYRVNPKALKREDREKAKVELKVTNAERESLRAAADARRAEILSGDQDYQAKLAAYHAARKRTGQLLGKIHSCPITVGTTSSAGGFGFFHVKAEGDNWEEVLEKVNRK